MGRRFSRRARSQVDPAGAGCEITIALTSPAATTATVGAKAANLAVAAKAGLPVLPGFGVPVTIVGRAVDVGGFASLAADDLDQLHAAWEALSQNDTFALVTRSSALAEDAEGSSMAGRFTSVLDVRGWRNFLHALDEVARSAEVIALDGTGQVELHDMAILVQRFLPAVTGGVLFGADPVTGRTDRLALATVEGGPEALVSGEANGAQQTLTRRGRALRTEGDRTIAPSRRRRRALATLARDAARVFGTPQDVEWAIDSSGALWLLQSRPVTTLDAAPAGGPVLGPGPIAETFPDPLTQLEQDLWLEPLASGIAHAIDLTGVAPRKRLAASPIAVAVGGRAAIDLRLIGAADGHRSLARLLDPRPGARRLRAAWRTGRLRRAVPAMAEALIASIDSELKGVPALGSLTEDQLLTILHGTRRVLVAVHGQEVLAGLLLPASADTGGGAAGEALALLANARRTGVPDARITALHPEVLALVPPAVRQGTLPPPTATLPTPAATAGAARADEIALAREALRLRARWIQELSALAAWELGSRLAARGVLSAADEVRHLDFAGLQEVVDNGAVPVLHDFDPAPSLPAMFRVDGAGRPFAVAVAGTKAGQGAGGGRRSGRVVHDPAEVGRPGEPVVLVTQTLAPTLAAVLPGLAGLVAETGSVLSHLAILARELGVPTVVGVSAAAERFPAGMTVVVDGSTGAVEEVGAR